MKICTGVKVVETLGFKREIFNFQCWFFIHLSIIWTTSHSRGSRACWRNDFYHTVGGWLQISPHIIQKRQSFKLPKKWFKKSVFIFLFVHFKNVHTSEKYHSCPPPWILHAPPRVHLTFRHCILRHTISYRFLSFACPINVICIYPSQNNFARLVHAIQIAHSR